MRKLLKEIGVEGVVGLELMPFFAFAYNFKVNKQLSRLAKLDICIYELRTKYGYFSFTQSVYKMVTPGTVKDFFWGEKFKSRYTF